MRAPELPSEHFTINTSEETYHFLPARPDWYVVAAYDEPPHQVYREVIVAWRIKSFYDGNGELCSHADPVGVEIYAENDYVGILSPDGHVTVACDCWYVDEKAFRVGAIAWKQRMQELKAKLDAEKVKDPATSPGSPTHAGRGTSTGGA